MSAKINLIPARFNLGNDPDFHGFHNPAESWNGFACPYFTREQAEALVLAMPESLSWDGDTIRYRDEGDEESDDSWQPINGLYAVGAWAWTWEVTAPTTKPSVQQALARKFSAVLRQHIGDFNMLEAIERNRHETSANVCHSHDFCDANMAMDEAFTAVMGRAIYLPSDWEEAGRCTEAQSDADMALWNEAWDIAKARHFFTGA